MYLLEILIYNNVDIVIQIIMDESSKEICMKKNTLILSLLIVIIIIIILTFKNNNENSLLTQLEKNNENNLSAKVERNKINDNDDPKDLESLQEIPVPDLIIFYHNGVQKEFINGTKEFNEIISLNIKRDDGKLTTGALKLAVDFDALLKNNDMLVYKYQNYEPIYFTLVDDEQLKNDNTKTNWVSVGYDSRVFKQLIYGGLTSADDLINYLNTLK